MNTEVRKPTDRWYVLAVLTIVYALNIADRYSISALIDPIRRELHLSDGGVAFLTGVSLGLFYVTLGLPIASLADRSNRRNLIAASLAVWSLMTALSGLAQSYSQFLLTRFGVGVGEAGGTPPSTSILADKFPAARRPMALAIYALGASAGAYLGSYVAASVAEWHGWRAALLVLGIPGLVVALCVLLTVKEPLRGELDERRSDVGDDHASFLGTLKFLRGSAPAMHLIAGGTIATLWSWGLMWWMPTFLQRTHSLSVGEAGRLLGPMHLVAGTAGSVMAWWFMGRPSAARASYIAGVLTCVTAVATIPSLVVCMNVSLLTATLMLWIFVPGVYFFIGPIFGVLQNVVPPHMRATTCAVLVFCANIANLVIAPQFVGWLSDAFLPIAQTREASLRWALLVLAPTGFWAAWHFWRFGATFKKQAGWAPESGSIKAV